ncbi:MAG: arylamine N-acetyltransferase [Myxococcales bacterium FL481]|nr:MAG: arylamine N-acetyltransferase [Myxococcales bacterium FL481]
MLARAMGVPPDHVSAYLRRLQIDPPLDCDHDTLQRLHHAHLDAIPFENLDIHLGIPIRLEPAALLTKLVGRRRGGFCYELNGAFAWLLTSLGFRVELLQARVYKDGALGIPFDHMCLLVQLESPWLCDVGFGQSHRSPLRADLRGCQSDLNGEYQIEPCPDSGEVDEWLELIENGQPAFRFSPRSRELQDFQAACAYHQSSPQSHFTQDTVCTLPTPRGRVTIRGRRLIQTLDGDKQEREIEDDAELLRLYRESFGVELDRVPCPARPDREA